MIRLILVGGFLGAGKTTLLSQSAQILIQRGYRVGIVTNDQGSNLVDTALIHKDQIPVTEVSGGCFCCNFHDFRAAVTQLQDLAQPDIILAEPVGSCTDLIATVVRPLMKYHSDEIMIAPLTILHDPLRTITPSLPDVTYLYDKQLAEADIIVLNKRDLLDRESLSNQLKHLKSNYPMAEIMSLSAKTGDGLEAWLDVCMEHTSYANNLLDIDYKIYADAEAALGWLNIRGSIDATTPFNAQQWMESTLQSINKVCISRDIFIAHVKSHLKSNQDEYKASVTTTGGTVSWDTLPENTTIQAGEFIINARVSTFPDELETIIRTTLDTTGSQNQMNIEIQEFECFSPLPPEPTYHIGLNEI